MKGRRIASGVFEGTAAALLALIGASVLTWPTVFHMGEVVIGGGELGGWMWRYWWHFTELDAIAASELSLYEKVQAFLALGRYPETGNILDVLLISYPLHRVFDFPTHYNAKIFLILVGNGVCGYALARSLTESRAAALAASLLAVVNPLVVQDLYGSGLRQVLLWWVLLLPAALNRLERYQRPVDGVICGALLALTAGFYWFYGLFAGLFVLLWLGDWVWRRRGFLGVAFWRWMVPFGVTTVVIAGAFVSPYLLSGDPQAQALPEVTFFLPYPEYDVVREAPLRPQTYAENVLSSLNRAIVSSWAVDYLWRPSYFRSLSFAVLWMGLLPALLLKPPAGSRARFWAVVFLVFWLATLGPFLKVGGDQSNHSSQVLVLFGDKVVRMPWTWMFRWVPGMSRMFAPYRMGAIVVVAAVALVAIGLPRLAQLREGRGRKLVLGGLSFAAVVGTLAQASYRFEIGPVPEGALAPDMWRPAVKVSATKVPAFYEELDPEAMTGIIELPLDPQQDLMCFYQVTHRQKVLRSWATPPAIPPWFRKEGGGEAGERMRYLAEQDTHGREAAETLSMFSLDPSNITLDDQLDPVAFAHLLIAGGYETLILHERGFYLQDALQGGVSYRDALRRMETWLGMSAFERIEHAWFDYPGNQYKVPNGPVYLPWTAQEVNLPDVDMPTRYHMAIFDLRPWLEAYDGPLPDLDEGQHGDESAAGGGPAHQQVEHQVVPHGDGRPESSP